MKLLHTTPSVGNVTKKMIEINPELSPIDLIEILKLSTRSRGTLAGEFATAEAIDEAKALGLTRATLKPTETRKNGALVKR